MNTKTTENKKESRKEIILKEVNVVRAYVGKTKWSDTEKNRITLKSDSIPYDNIHAFDKSGERLTPTWFKERNGYMNLSSIYDVPVKVGGGRVVTFEEWCSEYDVIGAIINIKITEKDGAVYPTAIMVLESGEKINPFEGME